MATHFPSIFKPISNTNNTNQEENHNHQTHISGLSLWMSSGHHHQPDHNQTIIPTNNGNITNPHHHHQLNWVFGNKFIPSSSSTSSCQELAGSTSIGMISVPSLYSSQHHHQTYQQTSSANMSATALLQKAAQIGATSTTCDPTFLGSLGLKCNNPQVGAQGDNHHGNDDNEYYDMYGPGSGSGSVLTNAGSGGGGSDQTTENNNSPSEMTHMHPAKRPRQVSVQNEEGGQTRDFLGVGGVQTICHPSSINGWV